MIIPTYQRKGMLREAVDSVLRQTLNDLECIVVDDGSPDAVKTNISDSRVHLVRRASNGGQAASINTGLSCARGKFVAFLDDDDLFTEDRLERALELHDVAPIAICWSAFIGAKETTNRRLNGWVHDEILNGRTPSLGATSILREIAPMLDDRLVASADIEWWLRASLVAPVTTLPKVGHLVRRHDGPRNLNGVQARIKTSVELLETYSEYFESHRSAAAHRWTRIGLMHSKAGNYTEAMRASWEALTLDPTLRRIWHFARSAKGVLRFKKNGD